MMQNYIVSIKSADKNCIVESVLAIINVMLTISEWQMGTYKDGTDIIPKTIIGLTKEGSAQVIGGELWLNGNKTGKSIAALSQNTWRNLTLGTLAKSVHYKYIPNWYYFQQVYIRCKNSPV